jgi:WD40 repeat protein
LEGAGTILSLSIDGRIVAGLGVDGRSLRVWEVGDSRPCWQYKTVDDSAISRAALSANGELLAIATADGTVRLFKRGYGGRAGG